MSQDQKIYQDVTAQLEEIAVQLDSDASVSARAGSLGRIELAAAHLRRIAGLLAAHRAPDPKPVKVPYRLEIGCPLPECPRLFVGDTASVEVVNHVATVHAAHRAQPDAYEVTATPTVWMCGHGAYQIRAMGQPGVLATFAANGPEEAAKIGELLNAAAAHRAQPDSERVEESARRPLTRTLNSQIVRAYTSKTHKPGVPSSFVRALIEEGVVYHPTATEEIQG